MSKKASKKATPVATPVAPVVTSGRTIVAIAKELKRLAPHVVSPAHIETN